VIVRKSFAFALALGSAALLSAQPTAVDRATLPEPELEQLVVEAIRSNPDLTSATASVEAARQRVAPARALPDPSLSFNYQNDGTRITLGERDMTFLGAMISQPLPWPGKLRLAGEEAAQRAEEAGAGVERARLAVEARVRRSYYEFLLARALRELTEDRGRSWREIADIVRDRYAAGLGIQQDVLRAQTEVLRVDEARADLTAQTINRRSELNRVLGRPQGGPIETDRRLEFRSETPDFPLLLRRVLEGSPELSGNKRAIEAARLRVALARKDFRPDFVASGGPMYRGGLDPMWQVGLGITLPIYAGSRQKPRLKAAEADVRSQEARLSSAALELEFLTRERFENLNAALRVARLYKEGVLPVDQLSMESAIASYRTGKVPFVTVLEALNTLYADRMIYLTRLSDSEKWRVALDEEDLGASNPMSAAAAAVAAPASTTTSSPSMR
jgi:outer membrane protein, heavy metal efflux system